MINDGMPKKVTVSMLLNGGGMRSAMDINLHAPHIPHLPRVFELTLVETHGPSACKTGDQGLTDRGYPTPPMSMSISINHSEDSIPTLSMSCRRRNWVFGGCSSGPATTCIFGHGTGGTRLSLPASRLAKCGKDGCYPPAYRGGWPAFVRACCFS